MIWQMALSFNVEEEERKFNKIVDAAAANYDKFMGEIGDHTSRSAIDLLTNFKEYFEYIIDIRKNQIETEKNVAATTVSVSNTLPSTSDESSTTSNVSYTPLPPKRGKNK